MSTHELSRTRRRTHAALVAAARDLVAEGLTPTVEDAAARADVSRTTAYRYFPNRTALLVAAHPEVATDESPRRRTRPDDPGARLRAGARPLPRASSGSRRPSSGRCCGCRSTRSSTTSAGPRSRCARGGSSAGSEEALEPLAETLVRRGAAAARVRRPLGRRHRGPGVARRRRRDLPRRGVRTAAMVGARLCSPRRFRSGPPRAAALTYLPDWKVRFIRFPTWKVCSMRSRPTRRRPRRRRVGPPAAHRCRCGCPPGFYTTLRRGDRRPDRRPRRTDCRMTRLAHGSWRPSAAHCVFVGVAFLLLWRFRRLNGVRVDGLFSRAVMGSSIRSSLAEAGGLVAAVWAAHGGPVVARRTRLGRRRRGVRRQRPALVARLPARPGRARRAAIRLEAVLALSGLAGLLGLFVLLALS